MYNIYLYFYHIKINIYVLTVGATKTVRSSFAHRLYVYLVALKKFLNRDENCHNGKLGSFKKDR